MDSLMSKSFNFLPVNVISKTDHRIKYYRTEGHPCLYLSSFWWFRVQVEVVGNTSVLALPCTYFSARSNLIKGKQPFSANLHPTISGDDNEGFS
jgi:hypothetical protein